MSNFGPYTSVRQADNLLFVSGQVGIDTVTKTAPPDIAAQTKQALKNLKHVLQESGTDMDDVVKTTIFLVNIGDFAAMNEIYEYWFSAPRPARSCLAVKSLPRVAGNVELLIEIEAIAYRKVSHE